MATSGRTPYHTIAAITEDGTLLIWIRHNGFFTQ
jgi:hypothetical protein